MRKSLSCSLLGMAIAFGFSALAADLQSLNGKWEAKKVNADGVKFSQIIEVKKDKFVFQIRDADDHLLVHAEGSIQLQQLGPFKSARFFDVRGGDSPSNLDEVNDEFNVVYTLDSDTWTIAANFDKERDQKASADVYQRIKSTTQTRTLVIDSIEMINTPQLSVWFICFEANAGGTKARHYQTDKGYDKNRVTIPAALTVPNVTAGQKCSFWMQLDDIDEDACGNEPDNRSTGEFDISEKGSKTFKPESNWEYTIHWHLK